MESNKKYYWLKLKEDFFEEDTINWLEEQENGKEYCLFYLKLCLKSLKTDGVLIRQVGDLFIPYDVKKLAEMTNTDIDTTRVAMEVFKQIGLIEVLENGEIYLSQLQNMVGSETASTIRSRKCRAKKEEVLQCNTNATFLQHRDRDRERDKEIDIEIEDSSSANTNLFDFIEQNFGRPLNNIEIQKILKWKDTELTRYAIEKAILNNKYSIGYIDGILRNFEINNIKTIQEAQAEENSFKKTRLVKNTRLTKQERMNKAEEEFLNE